MSSPQDATPSSTSPLAALLLDGFRQPAPHHVVHVGGGDGTLLVALLLGLPNATGVLFDTAAQIAASRTVLEAAGVTDRVDVVADDGGDPIPPGGDVYLTELRGENSDQGAALLCRCRAAMAPTARLVVFGSSQPRDRHEVLTDLLSRCGFTADGFEPRDRAWTITAAHPTQP